VVQHKASACCVLALNTQDKFKGGGSMGLRVAGVAAEQLLGVGIELKLKQKHLLGLLETSPAVAVSSVQLHSSSLLPGVHASLLCGMCTGSATCQHHPAVHSSTFSLQVGLAAAHLVCSTASFASCNAPAHCQCLLTIISSQAP
jgi:hypothetical protein